ncbi:MAG: hypothetical protein P8L37_07200, partial [Phycisphaerales bacterium]|nr:hypothetical protein [Phycisphaerales bacterium]
CLIANNSGGEGGGIEVNASQLNLSGCSLIGNTSSYNGGGIFAYTGTQLYMENCYVADNTANDGSGGGGGLLIGNLTIATLVNCYFENNTAANEGGGAIWAGSDLHLVGCQIRNNTASSAGGGIELVGDHEVTMQSTRVCGNTPDQIKFHEGSTGWIDLGGNSIEESCHDPSLITVNADGSGDYPSIQAAIDAAKYGDVIELSAGIFYESGLNTLGKTISISGVGGPEGPQTTVDAEGAIDNVFMIESNEGPQTVIQNLVIRGGQAGNGSGMFLNNSSPTIMMCLFEDNAATLHDGGAVVAQNSGARFFGCAFRNNTANRHGGAIWCSGPSIPSFEACFIFENEAQASGGGLYVDGGTLVMTDCNIDVNICGEEGGGVKFSNGESSFIRCYFDGNLAGTGGGGMTVFGSTTTIVDSEFAVNVAPPGLAGGIYGHESMVFMSGCEVRSNDGGGINSWAATEFSLSDTLVCGNTSYQIQGVWNDEGGNEISDECVLLEDLDQDGVWDFEDNCDIYNPDQADCNDNGVGDVCDLAYGTSQDCNANGLPDECEELPDCNGDGVSDACEIAAGAPDVNPADGVPDACQGLPSGACCIGSTCVPTTLSGCAAALGTYFGDGSSCAEAPCPESCPGDINGDGQIGIVDLLTIIDGWG